MSERPKGEGVSRGYCHVTKRPKKMDTEMRSLNSEDRSKEAIEKSFGRVVGIETKLQRVNWEEGS